MYKHRFILLNNYKIDNDNNNKPFLLYEIKNGEIIINENILKIFIIFLLIIIFKCSKNYLFFEENKGNDIKLGLKLNDFHSTMGNYSLYGLYKYEQISLLIFGIEKWKTNEKSILNFIDCLEKQTLKEIQIIFIFPTGIKIFLSNNFI